MRNFLTALMITLVPLAAAAETPEEKGLAIIQEADKRNLGWVDAKAELQMVLKNKQGQQSERSIRIDTLEVEGDGDKSLSVFDAPRDIKGTAIFELYPFRGPR